MPPFNFQENPVLGFVIQVVVITLLLLLFGEILPKIYANRFAPRFCPENGHTADGHSIGSFSPLIYILIQSTRLVNRRLAKKARISPWMIFPKHWISPPVW